MNFDPEQMSREQLQALADRMPFSGHAFQGLLDGIRTTPPSPSRLLGWMTFPPGYFDPVTVELSAEDQKQLFHF